MIKKLTKKIGLVMVGLGLSFTPLMSRAADFDATDTQGILTTAIANVSPTLKYGIGAVLLIALGAWAIFWVVGKLRRHTK